VNGKDLFVRELIVLLMNKERSLINKYRIDVSERLAISCTSDLSIKVQVKGLVVVRKLKETIVRSEMYF